MQITATTTLPKVQWEILINDWEFQKEKRDALLDGIPAEMLGREKVERLVTRPNFNNAQENFYRGLMFSNIAIRPRAAYRITSDEQCFVATLGEQDIRDLYACYSLVSKAMTFGTFRLIDAATSISEQKILYPTGNQGEDSKAVAHMEDVIGHYRKMIPSNHMPVIYQRRWRSETDSVGELRWEVMDGTHRLEANCIASLLRHELPFKPIEVIAAFTLTNPLPSRTAAVWPSVSLRSHR